MLADDYTLASQADKALETHAAGAKRYPGSAVLQKGMGLALFRRRISDPRAGDALRKAAALLSENDYAGCRSTR